MTSPTLAIGRDDHLLQSPMDAVEFASEQVNNGCETVRRLSQDVRKSAIEVIDVFLSAPFDSSLEPRKAAVIKEFSSLLLDFANAQESPIINMNISVNDLDQSMSIYLMRQPQETGSSIEDIIEMAEELRQTHSQIPPALDAIDSLKTAIKSSASGHPALGEAADHSIVMLNRLLGELQQAHAILTRLIILAGRLPNSALEI